MFEFLMPLLSKIGPALMNAGAGAAKTKGAQMLGEQFGQAAAASSMPQFGSALKAGLPAGMPSVAGGTTGGSPGAAALMQSTFGGQAGGAGGSGGLEGIMQKILGDQGSMRRDLLKAGVEAYGQQGQGSGGAGGGSPGGDMGLPPPMAVSVPPSSYLPVPGGAAEGFGGIGQSLAPLLPKAGLSGEPSDEERRILALQMAMRSLGGGNPGMQGMF